MAVMLDRKERVIKDIYMSKHKLPGKKAIKFQ